MYWVEGGGEGVWVGVVGLGVRRVLVGRDWLIGNLVGWLAGLFGGGENVTTMCGVLYNSNCRVFCYGERSVVAAEYAL